MLPIEIQMQIDLAARDLRNELAEGFAKARKELLPEPAPNPQAAWINSLAGLQNLYLSDNRYLQQQLMPVADPWAAVPGWWLANNAASQYLFGL